MFFSDLCRNVNISQFMKFIFIIFPVKTPSVVASKFAGRLGGKPLDVPKNLLTADHKISNQIAKKLPETVVKIDTPEPEPEPSRKVPLSII